ncbi:MAG: M14 family metallopeptidase [Bacteroidales bacterium]
MKNRLIVSGIILLSLVAMSLSAQQVPTPKEHFGFNIGDDYQLATYTQTEAYFKKLDAASDRVKIYDIGPSEEGRRQYMLAVSSPANIRNLERYKTISQTLGRAQGITDQEARAMADEGKAVVWIDGGLHATETVGTHQLIETAYQLASRTDKETLEILDNVIVLLAHANPDGQELVSSSYMREEDPTKRRTSIPRLYQKYAGHDNNRDFFMNNLKESQNISRQLYIEWIPQILYNHHQSGPAGTVVAGPPFRDPFRHVYDPLVIIGLDGVAASMANRLIAENKPGYTQKGGSQYSTWYNGGLRTTGYYHNIIGILTEIIGSPTPSSIRLVPNRLVPSSSNPFPIEPQSWNFQKSIDYSLSLNYAVLDYASRNRYHMLYNLYRMGMNSVERGSKDFWTKYPKAVDALIEAQERGRSSAETGSSNPFEEIFRDPERRDPRVFIVPSDQDDFPTAVRFINALISSGIQVHIATSDFTAAGKNYPAGSYIVKTSQAFRPHVLDMFEPQDHPNDLQYPGGPPIAPYDAAGWTPAFQMGISFDRLTEDVTGPFSVIPYGELQSPPAPTMPANARAGYTFSAKVNNSFKVVNDLLSEGIRVFRLPQGDRNNPLSNPGDFYVQASAKARTVLFRSAAENGVNVNALTAAPSPTERIQPARIALWDRYGGSMQSGWTRFILEQFNFPYTLIFPQRIDAGNLRKDFDIIIFVSGAIPAPPRGESGAQGPGRGGSGGQNLDGIPAEYHHMVGSITTEESVPQIKRFLEEGGVVITMESSTNLAYHLDIPIENAMVKTDEDGRVRNFTRTEYYVPGSVLKADINTNEKAAWGMPSAADFYFSNSNVFRFGEDASQMGVKKLAWFSTAEPLRSGWALGQEFLKDGIIAVEAPVGQGKLYLFGPNIAFRSQPHGLFKLIFNQLYK